MCCSVSRKLDARFEVSVSEQRTALLRAADGSFGNEPYFCWALLEEITTFAGLFWDIVIFIKLSSTPQQVSYRRLFGQQVLCVFGCLGTENHVLSYRALSEKCHFHGLGRYHSWMSCRFFFMRCPNRAPHVCLARLEEISMFEGVGLFWKHVAFIPNETPPQVAADSSFGQQVLYLFGSSRRQKYVCRSPLGKSFFDAFVYWACYKFGEDSHWIDVALITSYEII